MPAIDYHGIEENLQTILSAATGLTVADGVTVAIEDDIMQIMDAMNGGGKVIIIYLDDRIPTERQPIAAGTRTRFTIGLVLRVYVFGLGEFKAVANARDDLIGLVETTLMANRTLSNGVAFSFLGGGEFQSARKASAGAYLAMGEVKLLAEAMASTP